MAERYQPQSDFLKAVTADEVPLSGGAFGEANLRRLIDMTRDPDVSNRDWAALLLSQQALDTPEIRSALLAAARDRIRTSGPRRCAGSPLATPSSLCR